MRNLYPCLYAHCMLTQKYYFIIKSQPGDGCCPCFFFFLLFQHELAIQIKVFLVVPWIPPPFPKNGNFAVYGQIAAAYVYIFRHNELQTWWEPFVNSLFLHRGSHRFLHSGIATAGTMTRASHKHLLRATL